MNPERQEWFYRCHYSPERYARLRSILEQSLGTPIEFRIMEAPMFCSNELRTAIAEAALAVVKQCTEPKYLHHAYTSAIPDRYRMPDIPPHPTCAVVDFALALDNGTIVPRLIELQGFPSLFAYQLFLANAYHEAYELHEEFSPFFDQELTKEGYLDLLKRWLLADHHPDNTALVDYKPFEQKTYPDFAATQQLVGMAPSDICALRCEGNMLFHQRGGAWQPLRRIYMRAICDELEQEGAVVPFSWTNPPQVEWVVHPNWYFLMSKYSLPHLHHPSVPRSILCDSIEQIPVGRFVLKPLFAFAGKGVNINPTAADLEAIPPAERSQWILMEKVEYAPVLPTPEGNNCVEVRCMVIWEEGQQPRPTMSLIRTGRGALMGSRYLTQPWTGASICFFEQT
ncbi:MAG: hypothetical protein KatS3mg039_0793 [Candidatus Kapaibacterium sp.]|nr:MAG: hypothetical protein KatS3mg039_0793 [Candidatus Kapabacteria bacterium]